MKCDICGKDISLITINQFNTVLFGVNTGSNMLIKTGATVCGECCGKIIKFIDSISTDTGIVLP
jgi:hypothetical protein